MFLPLRHFFHPNDEPSSLEEEKKTEVRKEELTERSIKDLTILCMKKDKEKLTQMHHCLSNNLYGDSGGGKVKVNSLHDQRIVRLCRKKVKINLTAMFKHFKMDKHTIA